MKSKKFILVCLFILFVPSFAGAVETFSLEKSVAYGLEHSPLLEGSHLQVDQADMDIKSQRGRFLPSVSTGGYYSELTNEYVSGYENDTDYLDQKSLSANLRLNQTLFAGFEYKNRFERAKLGKEYQQAQLALKRLDLVFQIKGGFFELLKTRYDLSTITQQIKRLESDLDAARAFSDNKMSAFVYVLQAEADLEGAKQSLWQTQIAVFKHSARLKTMIGLSPDLGPVDFEDTFEARLQESPGDLPACLETAIDTRPEIQLFTLEADMAKKDAAIAGGRYYPRVNLDLSMYDLDKNYQTTREDDHYTYWTAGVSVQMSLFDGGTAYFEKKRNLLEVKRLNTEVRRAKMEIQEEVGVAFHTLEETRKRLISVEKALAASQESYTRQKKRFAANIGTTSEVLDAQAMLARAESGKSQALLDYQVALAQLYHAMGQEQTFSGQIKPELDK